MMTYARFVFVALCLVGCSPVASRCKDGTLLVAVTLDDASNQADQFSVTLSIDGVPTSPSVVSLANAMAAGNLIVEFPHGYPRGHVVAVAIDALAGGAVVGSGSASQPLTSSCEVLPLAVAATSSSDDLGGGGGDDLTSAADLSPLPPDMVCVPTAETGDKCFDGIDNDCDGMTDCADPDCVAGSQCVPAVGSAFTLGITVPQASFCPAMFSSRSVINSGLSAGSPACATSACTCTPSMSCSTSVTTFPVVGCSGETDSNSATNSCRNFNATQPTKGLSLDGPVLNNGGSCGTGGTSARSATMWATSSRFCQASAVGGGCAPGNVCVPKLSVPTCEVADGTVACDGGYTSTASWYTAFTDGRNCSCACGVAAGGSCGTSVGVFTTTDCTGTAVTPTASCLNASGVYKTLQVLGSVNPSCAAPTASVTSGTLAPTGPQTLCCRP
ncbi:MAG: cell wall surface anchor family protein [bacterium]|nr:cell wall surface anchor family protein [bacterium]